MSETTSTAALRAQWGGTSDLVAAVCAAIGAAGLDPARPPAEVVTALDQVHPGGLAATLRLAAVAGDAVPLAGAAVLDIGGGVGGPARTIARQAGATVTVLDLSASYCRLGQWLTARTAHAGQVRFVAGDALALPFAAAAFDLVWTQASGMNIADKERGYAEVRRVLRPGGHLVFQELATGRRVPLHFPVPWADAQDLSYLRPPGALRALVAAAGFRERSWADVSAETLADILALPPPPFAALGVQLLLGPDAAAKLQHLVRNLTEGRLAVVQGVFERR